MKPGTLIVGLLAWSGVCFGADLTGNWMAVSPTRAYPGDDVVDIVGIHYYDNPNYPRQSTQAEWDRQSTMTYAGGPMGIATWVPWNPSA